MGIRIHKVIGYGLSDVKQNDDRFYDQSAFLMEEDEDFCQSAESVYTKEGFIKYLKHNIEWPGLYIRSIENQRWAFHDNFLRAYEGKFSNVLVIVPPGYSDWYRYDNIIDYVEAGCGVIGDSVKPLQQGIWPHNSIHQNQHGEQLKPMDSCYWWRTYNSILDGDVEQEAIQLINKVLHALSTEMGFKDFHDAKDNIAPYVPDIVRAFCHYTNLFNDPDTVLQLRPMLFTYWQ